MARGRNLLGDAEGREGLARAAGHDELAPVSLGESLHHVGNGGGLVFAGFLPLAQGKVLWALETELGPVNRAGIEIVNGQAVDRLGLIRQRVLGVLAPPVRGGDDHAGGERFLA